LLQTPEHDPTVAAAADARSAMFPGRPSQTGDAAPRLIVEVKMGELDHSSPSSRVGFFPVFGRTATNLGDLYSKPFASRYAPWSPPGYRILDRLASLSIKSATAVSSPATSTSTFEVNLGKIGS